MLTTGIPLASSISTTSPVSMGLAILVAI
jgi:hypothetical protein